MLCFFELLNCDVCKSNDNWESVLSMGQYVEAGEIKRRTLVFYSCFVVVFCFHLGCQIYLLMLDFFRSHNFEMQRVNLKMRQITSSA